MGKATSCVVAILLHSIVFSALINTKNGQVVGCHTVERKALSKFKETVASDPTHRLSSWEGEDCCSWYGVTCHNVTRHVLGLDLRHEDPPCYQYHDSLLDDCDALYFSLRPSFLSLDPSLLELKQLEYLDLSNNNFNLIQVPNFIGLMKNLRYLNLSNAWFSGVVPPQLGNLTRLQALDLHQSTSSPHNIQSADLHWLSSLVNLKYLEIGGINVTTRALNSLQPLAHLTYVLHLGLSKLNLGNSQLSFLLNSSLVTTIQHLDLSYNDFTNPIPYGLANMTTLKFLDLSNNNLKGPLPYHLAGLSSLKFLDLSNNQLNGSIPLWVRAMKTLEVLRLNNNSFTHVEGRTIMGIIGKLCHLKELHLGDNNLIGEEIVGPYHDNSSKCIDYQLEALDLSNNSIIAAWPIWLGELKRLKYLSLEKGVRFYDSIPPFIGSLTSIEELHLRGCGLTGSIPYFLRRLSSLKILDLGENALRGSIPHSLGELFSLKIVDLSSNFLEGLVSEALIANLSSLEKLDLSNNRFFGNFPARLPDVKLRGINISHNHFTGLIPVFSSSSHIKLIDLSHNSFFGPLVHHPSTKASQVEAPFCQLRSLLLLNLQRNQLYGPIPDCWGKSEGLSVIDMSSNNLSGSIPKTFGILSQLRSLKLNNNSLQGTIPTTLKNLSQLVFLDLCQNKLTGEIPKLDLRSHPLLKFLILRVNQLEGVVPLGLCSLPRLQILDLAANNLTGSIPWCFGHFKAMALGADLEDDTFKGASAMVFWKGEVLGYSTTLKFVVNLDLSSNGLVGSIPEDLTKLSGLIGLNLSYNHLTESIPKKMGEMRSLESLDLSNNNISGTIPSSISIITSLNHMNLSNNKLHGQIPTGSQLQTFNDPSIYSGNAGLFGDPLPNKHIHKQHRQQGEEEKEDNLDQNAMFYVAVMLGFATGFWGVIGSLLLKKTWRYAVFRRVENVAHFLYVQAAVKINRLIIKN